MATCSPTPRPNYIERTLENDKGGVMGRILLNANETAKNVLTREGYDPDWIGKYKKRLTNALPMSWNDLENYFLNQGWMTKEGFVDRAGLLKGGEEGMPVAVAKTYLESVGAGIKQLADNFLMKVNLGEDATNEGLQLAQQMQHASKLSAFVLEGDQAYGRAVRAQGLRNNVNVVGDSLEDLGVSGVSPELAQSFGNEFQSIATKMGSPETYSDAIDDLVTLAKRVQFADSPLQAFRISGSVELAGSMWRETWVNGLLSSPATIVTNMAAFTWAFARPASQYIAAQFASSATGSAVAKQAAVEAGAALSAMSTAFSDALKLGWQAAKTERSIYAPLAGASEFNRGPAITAARLNEQLAKRGLGGIEGEYADMFNTLGQIVRLPSRALLGTDEFTKHLAIRGEIAARGVQQAAKKGVDLTDQAALQKYLSDEYSKAFKLDSPDPREKWTVDLGYEYAAEVRMEANRATFQEQNKVASGMNKLLQSNVGKFAQPFVPFVRTPTNIIRQGVLESTGLQALTKGTGYFLTNNPTNAVLKIQQELLKDPGESFRVAGQIALTSTLAGWLYTSVMSGQATGGGPRRFLLGDRKSYDAQNAWERAMAEEGRTPYSIATPFGQIPFDRLGEPVSIFLRMATDVASYSSYMSVQEKDASMAMIVGIGTTGLYQASFLKGVNDLIDAAFNDNDDGIRKVKAIENYARTQLPFGSLLNYVDKIDNPYRQAYENATFEDVMKVHEGGLNIILQKVAERIPGVGEDRPLIDQVTGEPIPVYPGGGPMGLNPLQMAIPFAPRGVKSADETWRRVNQIMGAYREARPTNLKLTQNEQQELNLRMSQVRIEGKTFQQWINQFYSRSDVQALVKQAGGMLPEGRLGIRDQFNSMKRKYMQLALEDISADSDNLLQRRLLTERIKQKNNANDFSVQDEQNALEALLQQALSTRVF